MTNVKDKNVKRIEVIENGESFEVVLQNTEGKKVKSLNGFNSLAEVEHYIVHKEELQSVSSVEVFPLNEAPYIWESMEVLAGTVVA